MVKRFFVDKIDTNQYGVYDRLKIGYIKPLVYTDWTVGLDYTQSVCDLFNDCDDKMNEVYEKLIIGKGSSEVIDMIKFGDNLQGVTIKELFDRNKKLEEDINNEKNDYRELFSNYINLQEKDMKLKKENEKLRQELQGMEELLQSYRKTIRHNAELLADASRNGYLPPLDDYVSKDGWICRCCKHFHSGVRDRCDKGNNWVLKDGSCQDFER